MISIDSSVSVCDTEEMTKTIDLTKVDDALLWSEINRRRAGLRKTFSGGSVWGKHNPDTSRCRCPDCNMTRKIEKVWSAEDAAEAIKHGAVGDEWTNLNSKSVAQFHMAAEQAGVTLATSRKGAAGSTVKITARSKRRS